ncbi:hypothetical protein DE146DRAFT_778990 [Phaeosphaeria sp. MPI-PUGE-AT-0046c]|nr:hypothetical protein DE146DRAFT_778990 [Phaeosphaeria sp. MPI-PUGE-AT-0046c]
MRPYDLFAICILSFCSKGSLGAAISGIVTSYTDEAKGCQALEKLLPSSLYAPESTGYLSASTAFWSLAAALHPYCVFSPATSEDLAAGVKAIAEVNSTFAIVGGGHAPVTGIASTSHGVLISLYRFQELSVSTFAGQTSVKVGAGRRWGEVYDYLNNYGLNVLGGRVWGVGMGSVLGGGMSFLSQQHGWMSNNVLNYELITAKGEILQVNKDSHEDLFRVLRNGGNNFGIVAQMDFKPYNQGRVSAVNKLYLGNDTKPFISAMKAWMVPGGGHEDAKGSIMPSTRYTPSAGTLDAAITAVYDADIEHPKAFENFSAIAGIDLGSGVQNFSQVVDTTKTQFGNDTFRWKWYSTAITFSEQTMSIIVDTMVDEAKKQIPNISGFVGVAEEPVSESYMEAARKNGGDPMNLDPAEGGLIVADYYVAYKKADEDDLVESFLQSLIEKVEEKTKAAGLYRPFYWLNTSGIKQQPFGSSLSTSTMNDMTAMSTRYDPDGVFQKLVPGFKLRATIDGS